MSRHLVTEPISKTNKIMTTATATKMVEIELIYALTIGKPIRRKNGTLGFEEEQVDPYNKAIKVLVPEEATASRQALTDFVRKEYQRSDTDIGYLNYINIWDTTDPEKRDPRGIEDTKGKQRWNIYDS